MVRDRRDSPAANDGSEEEEKEERGRRRSAKERTNHQERRSRNRSNSFTDSDGSHKNSCSYCWRQERNNYCKAPKRPQIQQQQQHKGCMDEAPFEDFNGGATPVGNDSIALRDSSNSAERSRSPTFTNATTVAVRNPENFYGNFHQQNQQSQRRPCTGAPSHGWRSLTRPGGGHGTRSADGEHPRTSKAFASRIDPTELSRLPTVDALVRLDNSRGWGEGSVVLNPDGKDGRDGCLDRKEEGKAQTMATGGFARGNRSSGAVRSRKQPPVVRRLKNTLQALNDSLYLD